MNTAKSGLNTQTTRLCGVYSTYAVLAFFNDESRNFGDILTKFPKVRETGMSLTEIRSILREKGYCCRIKEMTEKEIALGSKENAYVVLLEREADPHILMKRKISDEEVQIIDFPNVVKKQFDTQKNFTLVVNREDCSTGFSPFWYLGLFVVLSFVILRPVFKRRGVRHET
jgi:hypothetical protein